MHLILDRLYRLGLYMLGGLLVAAVFVVPMMIEIRNIPKPPPAAALLHKSMCETYQSPEYCEDVK